MNSQKGSATIILLVVLVVVLAAVLVYFVFLKKPGEVAVSPTPTPTKVVKTATPTPTAEAANLKNFDSKTSPLFKDIRPTFSFKYPVIATVNLSGKGPHIEMYSKDKSSGFSLVIDPITKPIAADSKTYCQNQIITAFPTNQVVFSNESTFKVNAYPGYVANYSVQNVSDASGREACVANLIITGNGYGTSQSAYNSVVDTITSTLILGQ